MSERLTDEQRRIVEVFARGGMDDYNGPCCVDADGSYLFPKAKDVQAICAEVLALRKEIKQWEAQSAEWRFGWYERE